MDHLFRTISRMLLITVTSLTSVTCPIGLAESDANLPSSAEIKIDKHLSELRDKAERGYVREQIKLGAAYLAGRGIPQDLAEAARWYEKAARSGDPEAENEIGYFYQRGIGVRVDMDRAAHWYQLSSAAGLPLGKVNLAVCYLNGLGVHKNPSTARQLLIEAVGKREGLAAAFLGDMSLFGLGVTVDRSAAERWFTLGARLHDWLAAYDLASLLTGYEGHSKDLHRAAELLRFSSANGYLPAKHSLGLLLVNHPELAQSDGEARGLLEEASAAGSWKSTVILGVLARQGTRPEPARALYYFRIAELQGDITAKQLVAGEIKALGSKLSPADQSLIAASAGSWIETHRVPKVFVFNDQRAQQDFPLISVVASPEGQSGGE